MIEIGIPVDQRLTQYVIVGLCISSTEETTLYRYVYTQMTVTLIKLGSPTYRS